MFIFQEFLYLKFSISQVNVFTGKGEGDLLPTGALPRSLAVGQEKARG